MRDAALLGRQLKATAAREKQLPEALETYEAELVRHGFDVVRESVASVSSAWDKTRFPDKRKHWTGCGLRNYATLSASPFERSTLRICGARRTGAEALPMGDKLRPGGQHRYNIWQGEFQRKILATMDTPEPVLWRRFRQMATGCTQSQATHRCGARIGSMQSFIGLRAR